MQNLNSTSRWVWRSIGACCLVLLMALGAVGQDQQGGTTAPTSSPPPVPAVRQADNLAVITIEGPIDSVTLRSVQRRMKLAEEAGADAIVIELDTPGGEVPSVLEITTALKGSNLHTIAWVNSQAISGGAIIALACDEIVVSSNATMGDAGIIKAGFQGMQAIPANERAKVTAPIIADLVDSARRHGYDEVLVQSFSTLGVETWQVRDTRTGQIYFLTEREYQALFGEAPPRDSEPFMASGGEIDLSESGEQIYEDDENLPRGESVDAGYTPGSDQITPGMADATNLALNTKGTPGSARPNFASEDPDDYEFVRYATNGNSFLTLTAPGLRELGFAKAQINTDEELRQFTGTPAGQMVRLDQTWSETLVKYMTQGVTGDVLRFALIIVFLLCMFIELSMPGTGVFGVLALIALVGLVVPPMMINASGWWPAVAVGAGLLFIVVEIFIMPGTAISGVTGLVLVLAGLVGTFAGSGEIFPGQNPGSGASLAWAASIVMLALFGAGVGMYLFSRYTKYVPVVNMLVLKDPPRPVESMLSAMGEKVDPDAPARVGDQGVATTRLMPSGQAEISGELVDVVAEHGSIDMGQRVRVVSATRYRVGVELAEEVPSTDGDAKDPQEGELS